MEISLTTQTGRPGLLSSRAVERLTALLLVLYCIAQVIAILARVASGTDQSDATFSIMMLTSNNTWYLAGQIANLAAAFLLITLAAMLYQVFSAGDKTLAMLSAVLFLAAGVCWLFSGVAGLALAEIYGTHLSPTATYTYPPPDTAILTAKPLPETAILTANPPTSAYLVIEPLRSLAGRVAFTSAAIAVIVLGTLIALARPLPRWVGWLAWLVGLAMLFIWDPEATAMHRLGGMGFLAWFLLVAVMLAWKGTQQPTLSNDDSTKGDD